MHIAIGMVDLQQEGMDLMVSIQKRISVLMVVGLCIVSCSQSNTNGKDDRGEIFLAVDAGYNTAYRNKSWVPVQVLVKNEQADLNGILEVRAYDTSNRLQSPMYHLPVKCPKDSNKRFSLMAYFDNTGRLEARLLENGRSARVTPSNMKILPIAKEDMMGIILDDDSLNYSFLNPAIQKRNHKIRLHRYALGTQDLAFLPNHLAAYEAFNFIVIGSIDPARVSQAHRALIRQYVESGGTLIVMSGLNGNRFKGTWVEELAGVQFGLSEDINEGEAAQRLFPDLLGSEDQNAIVLTQMIRPDDTVLISHRDHPLVSKRKLGSGRVYTLAVDAETHAFQSMKHYQALWSTMMFSQTNYRPLNIDFFTRSAAQMIPGMSGVNVRSLGFVVLYLMLYVGVGIIGNWLFWNHRKRREMAWVWLVVFSAGFSIYAFVSGTAGWAKVAEKQQVDVVFLKSGATQSDYYSLMGILTARTRSYSATQQGTNYLIKDIEAPTNPYNYNQARRVRSPFVFVQGDEPGMDRFTVGASELRFASLEGKLEQEGGFEGVLELKAEGIHGVFKNTTPYEIDEFTLLYEGTIHRVQEKDGELFISMSWNAIENKYRESMNVQAVRPWNYYGYQGEKAMYQAIRRALFVDEQEYLIHKDYPPLLMGWSNTVIADSLVPDREMIHKLQRTLVIAEVSVNDLRDHPENKIPEEELLVRMSNPRQRYGTKNWELNKITNWNSLKNGTLYDFEPFGSSAIEVRIPPWMLRDSKSMVELTFYVEETDAYTLRMSQDNEMDPLWHDEHQRSTEVIKLDGRKVERIIYSIPEWAELPRTSNQGVINFSIFRLEKDQQTGNPKVHYAVTARGIGSKSQQQKQNDTGDWPQWQ